MLTHCLPLLIALLSRPLLAHLLGAIQPLYQAEYTATEVSSKALLPSSNFKILVTTGCPFHSPACPEVSLWVRLGEKGARKGKPPHTLDLTLPSSPPTFEKGQSCSCFDFREGS